MGFTKKPSSKKKERRDQCCSSRVGARTVATPSAPYIPQCHSQVDARATNSTKLKTTSNTDPDPHDLHRVIVPTIRAKTRGSNSLEAPGASLSKNSKCDYHGGAIDLLGSGLLGFKDQGPNVQRNPFLTHKNVEINAISHDSSKRIEKTNRRQGKGSTTKRVVSPPSRLRTYNRQNKTDVASVMHIEGNGNPRPKPLIIHYNSASQAKASSRVDEPIAITRCHGGTRPKSKNPTLTRKDKAIEIPKKVVTEEEAQEFLK
ncbi:hypothetical protein CR513_42244, partial [Mucuna pruriens]